MTTLIADIETDGLLPVMTKIWTIQLGDADTEEATVYADQPGFPPLSEAIARLKAADRIVGHYFFGFDIHAINRLYPGTVDPLKLWDTLIAGRLLDPEDRKQSLEEWGKDLGILKGQYEGDWQSFTPDLVEYARQDIQVTRALYRKLAPQLEGWGRAVWLENLFAYIKSLQEQNGFRLNVAKAQALEAELRGEVAAIEQELQEIFPPWWVEVKTKGSSLVSPKRTVNYKDSTTPSTVAGAPFSRVELQLFNPGSDMQVEARFRKKYGWKPKSFTATGRAKLDEKVLASLTFPEAKTLYRYARATKRLGQLVDGENGWLKLVDSKTSRVHGRLNTIGTSTHRCSHFKPNMGQVDAKDLRMREVWEPRPGWKLVGCDAEGLELRMEAHYLRPLDGGKFGEALVNGSQKDGTDAHTLNQKAVGLYSRKITKSLVYACNYGAGDHKLGEIVIADAVAAGKPKPPGSLKSIGKRARTLLMQTMIGLDKLIASVRKVGKERGWVKCIDGSRIYIRKEHSSFNFLLQSGGAKVMKMAAVIFHFERCPAKGWVHGVDFGYCADVHDEVQAEVRPEIAHEWGAEYADCIREAGVRLGVRCPLAGKADIGNNWKETH